jgi:hypothetical protein
MVKMKNLHAKVGNNEILCATVIYVRQRRS